MPLNKETKLTILSTFNFVVWVEKIIFLFRYLGPDIQ